MTEDEAKARVEAIVGPAAIDLLARMVDLIITENGRQNLIASSTVESIWARHVLDSVQLLEHAIAEGEWLDIGTGGGFPGLAIAASTDRPVALVEPRRKRAAFLVDTAAALGLKNVVVHPVKVEKVATSAIMISARAVASMEKLLQASSHCATPQTRWLFLRGRPTAEEIGSLRRTTGLMFHVEQSRSDPTSSVVIAEAGPR